MQEKATETHTAERDRREHKAKEDDDRVRVVWTIWAMSPIRYDIALHMILKKPSAAIPKGFGDPSRDLFRNDLAVSCPRTCQI